jgi:hypothetical protein
VVATVKPTPDGRPVYMKTPSTKLKGITGRRFSGNCTARRRGVSVAPNGPLNLPAFRRPSEFGGTGKDPVWVIDEVDLPPGLVYRADPDREGHGVLEPAEEMFLAEYETAIASTQERWRKVEEREEADNDI